MVSAEELGSTHVGGADKPREAAPVRRLRRSHHSGHTAPRRPPHHRPAGDEPAGLPVNAAGLPVNAAGLPANIEAAVTHERPENGYTFRVSIFPATGERPGRARVRTPRRL